MSFPPLHPVLRDPVINQVAQAKQADIVVGLPTDTISPDQAGQMVKRVVAGLQYYYPSFKTTVIQADTGLKPDTRQAVQAAIDPAIGLVTARYTGLKGSGSAICSILHAALARQAKAIVILDSQTENLNTAWIPGLTKLILEKQADLIRPRYEIPLADSALSDLILAPFTRAVWGVGMQHPGASDVALSPGAAQTIINEDVWETDVSGSGFHIWATTLAITRCWRLAQTALSAKSYQVSGASAQIQTQFKEAVGTMFRLLNAHQRTWLQITAGQPAPTLTQFATREREHQQAYVEYPKSTADSDPEQGNTNNIEALALGWIEHRPLWQQILQPEHLIAIEYLAGQPLEQFYFPPDLWAKVVYDFSVVYNKGEQDPDAVVTALYPLYRGRLASFWPEIAGLTPVGRSGTVSAQGVDFEEQKPYLCTRWKTYKPGA